MRVSELDFEIMKFLSEMKFSNYEQIREKFFQEKTFEYPRRRLRDYKKFGLVESFPEWGGRRLNYVLSEKGNKLILRRGYDGITRSLSKIDLKNYEHDRILTDIRIKLENAGKIIDWYSERLIRFHSAFITSECGLRIIPDAFAYSTSLGVRVVVEFENSRKSNERIKKLLLNYQTFSDIREFKGELVLFFFSASSLRDTYVRYYQNMNMSFPVKFLLLTDIGVV